MAGRFDLAGVGPGDPELMTIKTIRAIKACQVLVLPIGSPELKKPELEEGEEETFAKECLAYRIACLSLIHIFFLPECPMLPSS